MTDVVIIKGSIELLSIAPTLAGAPVTPDGVAVVPEFSDVSLADFTAPGSLNGGVAVWVRDLDSGVYRVLCQMDAQSDQQAPIWELSGRIRVKAVA